MDCAHRLNGLPKPFLLIPLCIVDWLDFERPTDDSLMGNTNAWPVSNAYETTDQPVIRGMTREDCIAENRSKE